MNAVLCGNTQNQFVTAAYVYLDANSATLHYSAAAHPPMLLLRSGQVIEVTENGLMLAAFANATYSTAVHQLHSADRLLLYTDGVLEAANPAGEEFGPQRLSALLQDGAHLSAEAAADHIISSLKTWARPQNDDLTVLICDYAADNLQTRGPPALAPGYAPSTHEIYFFKNLSKIACQAPKPLKPIKIKDIALAF